MQWLKDKRKNFFAWSNNIPTQKENSFVNRKTWPRDILKWYFFNSITKWGQINIRLMYHSIVRKIKKSTRFEFFSFLLRALPTGPKNVAFLFLEYEHRLPRPLSSLPIISNPFYLWRRARNWYKLFPVCYEERSFWRRLIKAINKTWRPLFHSTASDKES